MAIKWRNLLIKAPLRPNHPSKYEIPLQQRLRSLLLYHPYDITSFSVRLFHSMLLLNSVPDWCRLLSLKGERKNTQLFQYVTVGFAETATLLVLFDGNSTMLCVSLCPFHIHSKINVVELAEYTLYVSLFLSLSVSVMIFEIEWNQVRSFVRSIRSFVCLF